METNNIEPVEGWYDSQAVTLEDRHVTESVLSRDAEDKHECGVRCSFKVYGDFHDAGCPMAGEVDYYAARDLQSRVDVAVGK